MSVRFALLLALVSALPLPAQSVWQASTNKNWNADGNWSVSGFPNSESAIAEFGATSQPAVTVSDSFTVDRIHFTASAPAYTFSLKSSSNLILAGTGLVNDSAATQTFAVKATGGSDARLAFINSASAANAVISAQGTLDGGGTPAQVAKIDFLNTSSAATAKITAQDAGSVTFDGTATAATAKITIRDTGSYVTFQGTSTAANAVITLVSGGRSRLTFDNSASAGQSTIKVNSGGTLVFSGSGSAGSADILATSALAPIAFIGTATAGSATVDTLRIDFSGTSTAGSAALTLRGASNFYGSSTAGSATLTVVADQHVAFNNTSSLGAAHVVLGDNSAVVFADSASGGSGVISGTGGLVKTGAGSLTLSGASTYTGATSIAAGKLVVNGSLANTAVTIGSGATLGGSGTIGGVTTISSGAHLAAGDSAGTLTFTQGLGLVAGSILDFQLGAVSDRIDVTGGTLTGPSSGFITLNLSDAGGFDPLVGSVFTLLNFSGATASGFDAADFNFGTLFTGTTLSAYSLNLDPVAKTLSLTYSASAIPEPSTCAAALGFCAAAFAFWRRKATRRRVG